MFSGVGHASALKKQRHFPLMLLKTEMTKCSSSCPLYTYMIMLVFVLVCIGACTDYFHSTGGIRIDVFHLVKMVSIDHV